MKKLILVAALAAAAWFGYRWFVQLRAIATYRAFAHAWTRGDMAEAGTTVWWLEANLQFVRLAEILVVQAVRAYLAERLQARK